MYIYSCMYVYIYIYIYIYILIKPGEENNHTVHVHLYDMCNHYIDKHLYQSPQPGLRSSSPAKGEGSLKIG
jgi:hypothetical protein